MKKCCICCVHALRFYCCGMSHPFLSRPLSRIQVRFVKLDHKCRAPLIVLIAALAHERLTTVHAAKGGWFHTGDQGFLDEEGYLTLTGRIKELINRGGEKISPLEVSSTSNHLYVPSKQLMTSMEGCCAQHPQGPCTCISTFVSSASA